MRTYLYLPPHGGQAPVEPAMAAPTDIVPGLPNFGQSHARMLDLSVPMCAIQHAQQLEQRSSSSQISGLLMHLSESLSCNPSAAVPELSAAALHKR